ncbi:PREDICTED: uncharacterized protein LOC104812369 [Tarenaya hassleriana]|uniref:uncharacterized protein LOC104812369 n=1 Tax=Tarenaya hassleriana TaxID=28532 RepID=UPI00053C94E7|nr:PREDICTED: uncharacterized protein LOC104812369 [Tarenaya hassleriana]XP_010537798.1 PREDICTED: uncharacterized protein LOC104812369 [Tarenaya hassleriana]XP_019057948.1 PREDICTED: uncharacterized protein LOC104812369 [Tarenaya hassleriana]
MDKPGPQQLFQHSCMEPGFGNESVSQGFMPEQMSSMNSNARPSVSNASDARPGLNYSMQTGEEFALEFLRDRVNSQRSSNAPTAGDVNYTTGYLELKGILGISHTGSECGSDVSRLSMVENGMREYERTNSSLHEFGNRLGHMQPGPQVSLSKGSSQENLHGYASFSVSGSLTAKMKVLCSFGGKILPRPGDSKLRYVGGETHIISIRKDISWQELKQKILVIYDQAHVMKYQLPGEDLDALVSVSCDEDLQNMIEECNEMENRGGSQKLRMFLFSISDLDNANSGMNRSGRDSEFRYVVAVNGMDIESRRNSMLHGMEGSSSNNLAKLDARHSEETNGGAGNVVGVPTSQLMGIGFPPSSIQYSQSIPPSSSLQYSLSIPPPNTSLQYQQSIPPSSTLQYSQSIPHSSSLQYSQSVLPSTSFQYPQSIPPSSSSSYGIYPPLYGHVVQHGERELFSVHHHQSSMPFQGVVNQQGGWTEGQPYPGTTPQNAPMLVKELNVKHDTEFHEGVEPENSHLLGTDHQNPAQMGDDEVKSNSQILEASVSTAVPNQDLHLLPPRRDTRQNNPVKPATYRDAVTAGQVPPASGDNDQLSTSSGACGPAHIDSESNLIDLNYPEPVQPLQRVYRSEKIPREQLELLNRLSKSDDSLGSQLLMSHSHLNAGQQDLENELDGKSREDSQMVHDVTLQMHKDVDTISEEVSASDEALDSGSRHRIPNFDTANRGKILNTPDIETETPGMSHVDSIVDPASSGVAASQQGDILIDINDRFPLDFLSEIFSKAISEDTTGDLQYRHDGAGLSLNVENQDPKNWSYFQKLAEEQFSQGDGSYIDQTGSGFPAELKDGGDISKLHHITPVTTAGISINLTDSQMNLGQDYGDDSAARGRVGDDTIPPDHKHGQMKVMESEEFSAMVENLRTSDFDKQDEKIEFRQAGLPPLDPSLADFDINSLQIIKNDDLEELKELGSGTFGTVYHGKWRGSDVAIKRIKKSCFAGRSSEQERLTVEFWREAEILSKLHHPNVVAFYGVVQDGPGGTLATVTEYMVDGSLRHVLVRKDRYLDRRKKLIIAMDAAFGMEYLHSKNIVHFDLKCDNLLVNLKDPSRPICKVGDFGLSKIKRNTLVSGGVRGTLPWMAPELLNGSSNKVSEKVDVFSFGIVLWEILTGEEPYANMHYGAIIGGIVNNTLRPTIPSHCDSEWMELMEECWAPNPVARPSFTEIADRLRVMSNAASSSHTKAHAHHKASK